MPVEMQVTDVRRAGERHVLMLEGGGRELKIWVGPAEALAIAVLLEDVELPRPGSHHLTAALLAASGAGVREVRVTRLAEKTFYAEVVLAGGAAVDARPSDAITLALVTGARLLVDPDVLDQAKNAPPEWIQEAEASTQDRRVLATRSANGSLARCEDGRHGTICTAQTSTPLNTLPACSTARRRRSSASRSRPTGRRRPQRGRSLRRRSAGSETPLAGRRGWDSGAAGFRDAQHARSELP